MADPAPTTDTGNKANAAARYAGSNASGALMVLAVLGGLPPEKANGVLASLHQIYNSGQDMVGAFANVWYIIFPVASAWLMKVGINSSSFGSMMDKVLVAAKSGNLEAQKSIVIAAASKEIGTTAIINPVLAPDPSTPSTVVASAKDLPTQAK